MSSPNEPGQPGAGDRPAGEDGSPDLPPWQAGTTRRPSAPPQRPAGEEPRHAAVTPAVTPAAVPAVAPAGGPPATRDPRSRYVTGIAAPDLSAITSPNKRPDSEPGGARTETITRTEAPPVEAYPSELPDLSAPPARLPQRRPPSAEAGRESGAPRFQVGGRPRGPVRASMQIRRIDPWSTLKVSALLSVALFFVWMIAVAFLYIVLGAMGVWSKLNNNVGDLLTSASGAGGGDIVSAGSIFGGAALVGLVNIVLLTAMATIGVYIYNLSTDIVGGVEVTLADLD